MIRPEDGEFHFNKDSHWQWAETFYLPFSVPESRINAGVYVLTRPMLGVCLSDITIMDRITDLWEDQLYIDNQQHMPCPQSLLEFSLPNGLRLKAAQPVKHYFVSYEGIDDTRFELEYVALHEPYDINDPAIDPTASSRVGTAWDNSWPGHYDVTYRVRGKLEVRGKRYNVDCVETGDRSWGPRVERDNGRVIWWHASFGERLTAHLFAGHDIARTAEMGPHISGYILEDGELFGLTDSRGLHQYRGAVPMGGEVEVTDTRGKKFLFHYSTVNSCYWAPYPSNTYMHSSIVASHEGEFGHGVIELGLSRAYLTRYRDEIRMRYG